MAKADRYSIVERLRDGSAFEIRALRPGDRDDMLAAIGRTSAQSLQRRFFVPKRGFSENEVSFFMNIDFENHVALVAQLEEDGRPVIVGGGRYVLVQPTKAELAFMVIDAYQGKGVGSALLRHLLALARAAGLEELKAEVLPENTAMLGMLSAFGFHAAPAQDARVRNLIMRFS
ncbi:GNAT family N-acetyltransferase [Bradyrhizobium sp. STM 3562]|uniref:GNAT family N-acetyltransferase n=1 Tax=Bradyrhizobium sp. STM 3562 TaxID=578924 RepID=UPI00388EFE67